MNALLLGLLLHAPASAQGDREYRMNDVGGTLVMPAGWEPRSQSWTDRSIKAQSRDNVLMDLWLTPFQPEVTPPAAQAWAKEAAADLEREGFKDVVVASSGVETSAGRPTGVASLKARTPEGADVVSHVAAFASNGQTIHVRTTAAAQRGASARQALQTFLGALKLDSGALPAGDPTVESGSGFKLTLPAGWRPPFEKELEAVRKITAALGEEDLDPSRCLVGVRPPAAGDPDVIFACDTAMALGPVDEHSFAAEEQVVHQRFFGDAAKPVAPAVPAQVGDRMGFYYALPVAGAAQYRLALAPYDKGLMVTWAVGNQIGAEALDADLKAALASAQFTGPDGGKPRFGPAQWIDYYVTHRPTSFPVLSVVFGIVAALAGVGMVIRGRSMRRPPPPDDY